MSGVDPRGDPHAGRPVLAAGAPLGAARAAMVLLHGRGAGAADILGLHRELAVPDVAFLAPQAAGGTWYPYSFLAPLERNEPWLGSALAVVHRLLSQVEAQGVGPERTVLLGFSQGACLALEAAARRPRGRGGVVGLSGGLIGPPGTVRDDAGDCAGTPVFLGCSDRDPHVPWERVEESAAVFRRLGAAVTLRMYPGLGHTVNEDELAWVGDLLRRVTRT